MASSSRMCSINSCKRSSRALCYCCQQNLCIDHLKEHSDILNAQLIPLAEKVNTLSDQFNNVSLLQSACFTELNKWRVEAHRAVDRFCDMKQREFEEFIHKERNKQKAELDRLRDQINKLIREQELTKEHIKSMNDSIRLFQQKINQFQFPQFTLSPLIIDDRPVVIHQKASQSKDLLPLSPPCRTINVEVNWRSIAANDNHLLVVQGYKLCLLNRQLIVHREIPWTHDRLYYTFWSKTLAQFILITEEEIFTLDEKTMTVGRFSLGGNKSTAKWYRGTCSNNILFLSTVGAGASIYQYTLLPSVDFVKKYRSPVSCTKDEGIEDMSSNSITLALIIKNLKNEVRLDLCSLTTLERRWSIQLGFTSIFFRIRCCSLRNDQWMIINPDESELWHISADAKLLKRDKYNPPPWHAVQLSNDLIAILTENSINLHQLS